jgi:hypothetical protein
MDCETRDIYEVSINVISAMPLMVMKTIAFEKYESLDSSTNDA